ncbi:hypothetical protein ACS0QO_07805, partial [Deinococcus aquaticus]
MSDPGDRGVGAERLPAPSSAGPASAGRSGAGARGDVQAVLALAALPMLAGAWLPWVLLRPNRLAPGEYLRLPPVWMAALLVLALLPLAAARWRPALTWVPATLALLLAVWLLGTRTGAALVG